MSERTRPARPALRLAALAAVAAIGLGMAILLFGLASDLRETTTVAARQPIEDIAALPLGEAVSRAEDLVAWSLEQVYAAFEQEEEAAIYDALAVAVSGDALDTLYLQRRAALADRGLDGAGQEVHELEILSVDADRDGEALRAAARWRVLGLVGHERHRHMRGNAYSAGLTLDRIDERWRITGFDLRAVDRTDAGVVVDAPPPADAAVLQ